MVVNGWNDYVVVKCLDRNINLKDCFAVLRIILLYYFLKIYRFYLNDQQSYYNRIQAEIYIYSFFFRISTSAI